MNGIVTRSHRCIACIQHVSNLLLSFNHIVHSFCCRRPWVKQFSQRLREPSIEFENLCGMSSQDFSYLLDKIAPIISKKDTHWRKSIPAKDRLAIALRFLATGDTYSNLRFVFKVSSQLISKIVPEVCAAINEALKDEIKVGNVMLKKLSLFLLYV